MFMERRTLFEKHHPQSPGAHFFHVIFYNSGDIPNLIHLENF